jgi:glycyl-tRNA synthetase (class II)
MKIEILRRTSITGRPVLAGDVVEASDADARFLIGSGKARQAEEIMPVVVEPSAGARRPRTRKPLTV